MNDDKNCQSPVCSDINCQETQDVHIQPVTKSNCMWLAKPASLQSASKQKNPRRQQYVCDGKFQVQNKQIRDTKTQAWNVSTVHLSHTCMDVYGLKRWYSAYARPSHRDGTCLTTCTYK